MFFFKNCNHLIITATIVLMYVVNMNVCVGEFFFRLEKWKWKTRCSWMTTHPLRPMESLVKTILQTMASYRQHPSHNTSLPIIHPTAFIYVYILQFYNIYVQNNVIFIFSLRIFLLYQKKYNYIIIICY